MGYKLRTNIVKDEKGDLFSESNSILVKWRNHFSQLLNIDRVNDVRQREIHTAEPHVPEPSGLKFQLAIEKLKSHKAPGIDHIPAELIKAGCRAIRYEIHKLTFSIWNKEKLPESGRSRSLYLSIRRVIKQIVVIIGTCHFCQLCTKCYPTSCCQSRVLVGKPEGKRPLERPRHRWDNNIKLDFQEVGWWCIDWIDVAQERDRWWALVNAIMNFWVP
jgi:hypothetical protein